MFQGVLEAHTPNESRQSSRRELGAHYTSERNILRVIDPLFMDDLRSEFEAAKRNKPRLKALYDKLPALTFLDPACGCGNFLVIAYRELRRLENEVIAALFDFDRGRGLLDVATLCRVRVSQFCGIEIDEAAAHIARVAMWITDHQLNLEAAIRFGNTRPTVPLTDSPTVVCGNALRIDWASVLPPERCSYVMGNPPFIGAKYMNELQRSDAALIFEKIKNGGLLDYVAAWYFKALRYMQVQPTIQAAFVSTNSITQGEQVAALWPPLINAGIKLRFAHRTFKWSNEGRGNAAVHCVIVGFGLQEPSSCRLWDYGKNLKGNGFEYGSKRINPYLVDGPDVWIEKRRTPICEVPSMHFGNQPIDGGHLLFSDDEKDELIQTEPAARRWIKPFIGADEFINNVSRWCLWLKNCSPSDLRAMSLVYKRVQAVKAMRLASDRPATQELAATPSLFAFVSQPETGNYLLVPSVSSEKREYVPTGFLDANTIASNLVSIIPQATTYHFANLNSTMHNAWMRTVCGRLKSDYRYSASIVYNNFPWPDPTQKQHAAVEIAGQAVLDARALYPNATLADLYDPLTMPAELRKAHQGVDKAVDAAYGYKGGKDDAARVAYLFILYQQYTSLLPSDNTKPKRRARAA